MILYHAGEICANAREVEEDDNITRNEMEHGTQEQPVLLAREKGLAPPVGSQAPCGQVIEYKPKEHSLRRHERRVAQKQYDAAVIRRVEAGLKPYSVQVRRGGYIDGGCEGHLKWEQMLRTLVPRCLDMSKVRFTEQHEKSVTKLRDCLDAEFEYLQNELSDSGFLKSLKRWMRSTRGRLKARAPGSAPSLHFDPTEWAKLNEYWDAVATYKKSEEMSKVRKKVVHQSRAGKTGFAGKEAQLVSYFVM